VKTGEPAPRLVLSADRPVPSADQGVVSCPACGARMAYEGHCKYRCTRPCGFFMGCSEGW
jgi:hypothetical protein